MKTYRLGTTHENHLGPPRPEEVKREPDESLEDFSKRVLDGIPLSTWAVITIGRGWADVRPVLDEATAREDVRGLKELESRNRQMPYRGREREIRSYIPEYLELASIAISGNYITAEPPKEE